MIELTDTFLITFLFVFAVVFGVLSLGNVFKNRIVNGIVSLAIALFASSYQPFVSMLFTYLPGVTGLFIVMFFIAFMLELFGLRKERKQTGETIMVGGIVLLVLLTVGYQALTMLDMEIPYLGNAENVAFLVGFIIIIAIIAAALKFGGAVDFAIFSARGGRGGK